MYLLHSIGSNKVDLLFIICIIFAEKGSFWFGKASITSENKTLNIADAFLKFQKICKIVKGPDSYCFSGKVHVSFAVVFQKVKFLAC